MTHLFTLHITDPGAGGRLDAAARKQLRGSLREAGRSDCRAVLVTVEGDAWAQDQPTGPLTAAEVEREFHALLLALFGLDRPVVLHLAGRVSGFGLALALACDVRIGDAEATFATGGPQLLPLGGLGWLLTERAGAGCASRLAWSGTDATGLTAPEALTHGVLTGVGAAAAASAEAERIAAISPALTSALKRSLNRRVQGDLEEQLGYDAWLATLTVGAS
jgi:enoyl-CoA hydratase/2-(1,2-epoxy-1,2-dihydrophenyl)acetyl-CoA isomerase